MKKEYKFNSFPEAMEFVKVVATIAESHNHHPKITINYNKVEIESITHDAGNTVTEKDENLMAEIDKIYQK